MRALRIIIMAVLCCVGLAWLMLDRQSEPRKITSTQNEGSQQDSEMKTIEPLPELSRRPLSRPARDTGAAGESDEKPAMLDGLNDPRGSIERDLAVVENLLFSYHSVFQEFPYGENADWVRVFRGENRRGIAFIATEGDWINASGEIIDRWGTPFFFHRLSGAQIEIRSAGPDGAHWTDDDFSSFEPREHLSAPLLMATETPGVE